MNIQRAEKPHNGNLEMQLFIWLCVDNNLWAFYRDGHTRPFLAQKDYTIYRYTEIPLKDALELIYIWYKGWPELKI